MKELPIRRLADRRGAGRRLRWDVLRVNSFQLGFPKNVSDSWYFWSKLLLIGVN